MDEFCDDVPLPEGWTQEDLEQVRAEMRRIKEDWAKNPSPPSFETQILTLLREQTGLLREIRDLLGQDRRRG
jgi:hypothetical protein